jgi:hypothetical protein
MNTVETIQEKVTHLPPEAQEEVLQAVVQIEERFQKEETSTESNGDKTGEAIYPLTLIANLAVDVGVTDLAERHDFYAHGKLED